MFKKIGIGALLVSSLLFGSGFSHDVQAQSNHSQQIYYQFEASNFSNTNLQDMINQLLAKYPAANVKVEENKQEVVVEQEPGKATPENNKVEQPQAPVKEETAAEQPAKETDQAAQELSQFEQQVVALTNAERQKQGLAPLKIDTELSKVARVKSQDMATNGYFSHNSPTYGSPFDMMKQFGINYRTAGENIAKGQQSPEEVVKAWMNSEGHRANILNANFTHIGVGYVANGDVWTQQFIGK
ncbi:uncharacterized protein, YkwD family [Gracilibacillus ureilyticus]|uniref:Uncharacterized protein, YkwD family n=1 Tax=Gracilibacillus ureilyticus TaxID=531814 RepID=A0A1H9NFQ1_9BACI|nr:CAP domain-containing protein [Gracilibacillus ureilyticus]SER34766.1 uncharacterized protein, YkwD family [Gracilibacillus ureilyticus]